MLFASVTKTYNYFWKNLDHMELERCLFVCLKNLSYSFSINFIFITKPWQFLLVSFVKGHLLPQVHEWCVKALLLCEQTHERGLYPSSTCQACQELTRSLNLKASTSEVPAEPWNTSWGRGLDTEESCTEMIFCIHIHRYLVTSACHILANTVSASPQLSWAFIFICNKRPWKVRIWQGMCRNVTCVGSNRYIGYVWLVFLFPSEY